MTNAFAIDRSIGPCVRVTITLPRCTRKYGVAPCTAPLATTSGRCYNNRFDCLDPDNYDGSGKKEVKLISEGIFLTGWKDVISDYQHTPPELLKNWAIWREEKFVIRCRDIVQAVENEDDDEWYRMRANTPYASSYWSRLQARYPFFNLVPVKVEIGSISGSRFRADSIHHMFLEKTVYSTRGMEFRLIDGLKICQEGRRAMPQAQHH